MTDQEIAGEIVASRAYRKLCRKYGESRGWFRPRRPVFFPRDAVERIVARRRNSFASTSAAEWSESYEARTLKFEQCETFGVGPAFWVAVVGLVINILRLIKNR